MKLSSGLLAAVLLTMAVPAYTQTLGELAKKEQERRKAAPPAAKTYTNDDLKKIPPPPPPAAGGDSTTKAGEASKPPSATPVDPTKPIQIPAEGDKTAGGKPKDEAYWRGRITVVREELRRDEVFRDALQVQINGLAGDFAGRDDPAQRAAIADERQKKIAEMERLSAEIEKAKKAILDIEEEARRAGVPPGWLR
jgi:hypothetical protein